MAEVRVEVKGPFSGDTFIELQRKSGEIVRNVREATEKLMGALIIRDGKLQEESFKKLSEACEQGIKDLKKFPEAIVKWSSNPLIRSLEETQIAVRALQEGNERDFLEHFQKATEEALRQNYFLETLKHSLSSH